MGVGVERYVPVQNGPGNISRTKLTDGFHTRGSDGYRVVATDAPSRHCGRVAVFYQPSPCYVVAAVQQSRPNVIRFPLATGERQWYIIGCYLAPNYTLTIESVVAELKQRPQGGKLLVTGDLNVNLADPEGDQEKEEIAAALKTARLEDMLDHFLPQRRPWCRYRRMWSMLRVGKEMRSRMDYILGTYRCLFCNVTAWEPRHK